MDHEIIIRKLNKEYVSKKHRVKVINDLSLTIKSNQIFCITGPSGSGKSTLLYIIGGLLKPTSGAVIVDKHKLYDKDKKHLNIYRSKCIGFVFQMFYLMPHLNALENVLLPMYLSQDTKEERINKAKCLLAKVGMLSKAYSKPSQLSGGQQQRVAIARALANDADIIIADEPTGNVDIKTEQSIIEIFKELKAENKIVIIVTHNKNVADCADSVVELGRDRLR